MDSTVSSIVRAPRDVGELQYGLELQSAVLRERGQPGPALEAARRFHRVVDSVAGRPSRDPFVRLPEALALLELGATDPRAARAAAKLFNDMATMPMYSEPRMARHRVWMWTHEASALALAGDTAALPGLARRIEEQSLLSAYGRDQRMPFYVTGLLLEARRDWLGAAEAYRRAIWSPTENHVSPRLARALLASGRPAEAIPVLQSWLRGPLDAANQYVRRSEVHRLLGEAFQKLNRQDSASAHYAWVRGAGRPAPSGAQ